MYTSSATLEVLSSHLSSPISKVVLLTMLHVSIIMVMGC